VFINRQKNEKDAEIGQILFTRERV